MSLILWRQGASAPTVRCRTAPRVGSRRYCVKASAIAELDRGETVKLPASHASSSSESIELLKAQRAQREFPSDQLFALFASFKFSCDYTSRSCGFLPIVLFFAVICGRSSSHPGPSGHFSLRLTPPPA